MTWRFTNAIPPARINCPDCTRGVTRTGARCTRCDGKGYLKQRFWNR
jgi:hypothetical protein